MKRDKPDGNAKELISALELEGWSVQRLGRANDKYSGVPDSLVSRKGSRLNHLLEIKAPGGKLRESQTKFMWSWPGCVHVAMNSFEANLLLLECERRYTHTRDPLSQSGAVSASHAASRPAFSTKR